MATFSSENYTLGMASLKWKTLGGSVWNIGNIVASSIAPETTVLDHFTVDNGIRKKDRSLITQKSVAINFTFDEITGTAIKHFLLATMLNSADNISGNAVSILPMEAGEINGCAQLEFNSQYGRDFTWFIPSAAFKPDGSFDFNAEDWMNSKGIIEVLQAIGTKADRPYGWIEFDELWNTENEE